MTSRKNSKTAWVCAKCGCEIDGSEKTFWYHKRNQYSAPSCGKKPTPMRVATQGHSA